MSKAHMLALAFTVSCVIPSTTAAQLPADLQEAMRARDQAVSTADAATWDRLTADDFTVVLRDGTLMTKAERLAQLKTETATTPVPLEQVQIKRYGDVFWAKDARGWRVAAVQVTTAKK